MLARAEELGCADVLEQTWSCWYPQADGSPCQRCLACRHRHVPQQRVQGGAPSPPIELKSRARVIRDFVPPSMRARLRQREAVERAVTDAREEEEKEEEEEDDGGIVFEDPFADL